MTESLDISLHGVHRVEIIERLVHICRYTPGLVFLDGEPGKSPVRFLQHMANLLRDELDFALLEPVDIDVMQISASLMSQWFVYRADDGQTDIQRIHHFLDVGAEAGRLALIVVLRTAALGDEAMDFLVSLMARHSRLTVFFSGVADTRPMLRRAQQAEVPVHRIELPETDSQGSSPHVSSDTERQSGPELSRPQVAVVTKAAPQLDHTFSDLFSKAMESDDDLFEEDDGGDSVALSASRSDAPVAARRSVSFGATVAGRAGGRHEPALGVSTRFSAMEAWGAATFAGIKRRKMGLPLLLTALGALGVLLLLAVIYQRDEQLPAVTAAVLPGSVVLPSGGDISTAPAQTNTTPPPVIGVATSASRRELGAEQVVALQQPQGGVSSAAPAVVPVATAPAASAAAATAVSAAAPDPTVASVASQPPVSVVPKKDKPVVQSEQQWRAKPENYTVQLAAVHGEQSVRALAARLPGRHPHFIYQTRRDGKPWYVLVYGSFSRREAAVVARDELVASLKLGSGPWVRKQGEIFR